MAQMAGVAAFLRNLRANVTGKKEHPRNIKGLTGANKH